MNLMKMSRLLEATEFDNPKSKINRISKVLKEEDNNTRIKVLRVLSLDLKQNNIGLVKGKKWLAEAFGIFEDELDMVYTSVEDIGETAKILDSTENSIEYSLNNLIHLLELDCSNHSIAFPTIKETLLSMSDLERKWFVKYWLRLPKNGLNEATMIKILAKIFSKPITDVKNHWNHFTIEELVNAYSNNKELIPSLNHGRFIKPMLAKEVEPSKWKETSIVDFKYDGNRYQIHKENESVIIFNRKGSIVNYQFPDVVERILHQYDDGIYDGEIYPIDSQGHPIEHKHMGTRVHSKNWDDAKKIEVKWVVFDCLKIKGKNIMHLPYEKRIQEFSHLPYQAQRQVGGDFMSFYHRAISEGFEGVIVKDNESPYLAGSRSIAWAKYKPPRIELDVVIVGARYGEGSNVNVFSSFDIAVKESFDAANGFKVIGSVGTGFSQQDLSFLTRELRRFTQGVTKNTYHFLPRVILTVNADLVTRNVEGDLALRFPRMTRIREDKIVSEINTLEDVELFS